MHEDSESYTVPATSSRSNLALPTLFVLRNHPQSLAVQLLLQKCQAQLQDTIRVTCTAPESNHVHPYMVLPQNETIDSATLMRWLNRGTDTQARGSKEGNRQGRDVDCIAFESLLIDLDETITLARYLDLESTRLLGPWHAHIVKPTSKESRLVGTGWEKQLRIFSDAIHALQTFIATGESSTRGGEVVSTSQWITLQVVAHVHVLTHDGNGLASKGKRQGELRRVVEGCPELMGKCAEMMQDCKDQILF
ncbi:protein of unknown function [Taphrina deformans PYCC 5710]|uniref:Uncharacterized protein n=1 Tax=Taphrina deformans (strain PYCC 5710 / ATCC 11124 / CBS 356.35 / IMI 108563 / JCM 9778 / NBRC 8474) TaxID=1097556 RepID=R4XFR2_TAPDE|nr:protein of unknown function [Taphrina deformans PYCC 5710]|eukprot:CCG82204.1 protein of unknown function [Taphrina deformans PYCC 5710]